MMTKHRVELLLSDTNLMHSGLYLAGFMTLSRPKTGDMLVENITEPAQTECSAPIIIPAKKWNTPILSRLPDSQCSSQTRLILDTTRGQIKQFAERYGQCF